MHDPNGSAACPEMLLCSPDVALISGSGMANSAAGTSLPQILREDSVIEQVPHNTEQELEDSVASQISVDPHEISLW